MPVRSRRPDDEKPLFKATNQQRLVGPVSAGQNGASQAAPEQEQPRAATQEQAASQAAGATGGEKGPVSRALDRAEQNNWVYSSIANAARESGLVATLDDLVSRLNGR